MGAFRISRFGGLFVISCVAATFCAGCADSRSLAALTVRPAGAEDASYAEEELVRPARFAVSETTVLAFAAPVPKNQRRPHNSFRASEQVVIAASVAKPVEGRLLLLSGTSVRELAVSSLTLIPDEVGLYELRVQAKDDVRTVELAVKGKPSTDFEGLHRELSKALSLQRVEKIGVYGSSDEVEP